MELHIWIGVLSVTCCWTWRSVLSTPAAGTPTPGTPSAARTGTSTESHVRTKRCSCATFLDKECVYFCHLDIIWVNTPGRLVSYGMGNAPRTRRALRDSMVMIGGGPRCACLRGDDATCTSFCSIRMKRTPVAPKTHLLLEDWRAKQRHLVRSWEGKNAAS